MYQEAENGIFKPVLGALGVATVFLTIVGNFVFAPKPSSVQTVRLADAQQAPDSERARQIEPAPAAEVAKQPELAPHSPRDLAIDVPVAEQSPPVTSGLPSETASQPESAPKTGEKLAAVPVEGPVLPGETASHILLVESAPVAEPVPLPEPAPNTDESVAALPQQPPAAHETASDVSAAHAGSEPVITPLHENSSPPPALADADRAPPFVIETLSHHDRRMLRKAEHLAKKQIRLAKHGRVIACR